MKIDINEKKFQWANAGFADIGQELSSIFDLYTVEKAIDDWSKFDRVRDKTNGINEGDIRIFEVDDNRVIINKYTIKDAIRIVKLNSL